MIKVLFFARLREQLSCDSVEIDHLGLKTVTELRQNLIQQYPHWTEFLSDKRLLVAVNQTLAKPEHVVGANDEVAFFPPVTGG